jgi:hypothetical protein
MWRDALPRAGRPRLVPPGIVRFARKASGPSRGRIGSSQEGSHHVA